MPLTLHRAHSVETFHCPGLKPRSKSRSVKRSGRRNEVTSSTPDRLIPPTHGANTKSPRTSELEKQSLIAVRDLGTKIGVCDSAVGDKPGAVSMVMVRRAREIPVTMGMESTH